MLLRFGAIVLNFTEEKLFAILVECFLFRGIECRGESDFK